MSVVQWDSVSKQLWSCGIGAGRKVRSTPQRSIRQETGALAWTGHGEGDGAVRGGEGASKRCGES